MSPENVTPPDDRVVVQLRRPVVVRVVRRGTGDVLATLVAFSGVGLVAVGIWAAALAGVGVWPRSAWPILGCVAALAGLVGGLVAAAQLTARAGCSDALCDGAPGPDDAECPGCGRTIVEAHGLAERVRRGGGRP